MLGEFMKIRFENQVALETPNTPSPGWFFVLYFCYFPDPSRAIPWSAHPKIVEFGCFNLAPRGGKRAQQKSMGAASCEHGNRYDGEGLSFFKNSSGRNSNIWIYNCLNLIDLSLKNVLLRARSWWTGRKRRRPEDEGAPVVHVFQGEGRRRLKRKGTGGCISVAVFQNPPPQAFG